MAAHIFAMSEENYKICICKGLVGIPEPKEDSRNKNNIFDGLLSRLMCIKENDYILIYIIGAKELRGIWKADGLPFYDETIVWADRIYPFRCKIKISEFCFENSLKLNDITDMKNNNKIWTWALQRASGSNAVFSISNNELTVLINEYLKINPFSLNKWRIPEPYPFIDTNLISKIHFKGNDPQYEFSIMAFLNNGFANGLFKEIFGNYSDVLSYVPTSLGREMDILLMYSHPQNESIVLSNDIIEVKRDEFDEDALTQLIDYESWFLHKKVSGDMKMVRTTAIAKSFSDEVINYVACRKKYEGKYIKLVKYSYENNQFKLTLTNK